MGIKEITLTVLSVGVALVCVETALSFYSDETHNSHSRYIRLKEHPPLVNRVINNKTFATDKYGFIKPSIKYDNPDLTILFLGGSTTECVLVDQEFRFPNLTGRLLEITGKKINTLNSGVSGNNSMHSINTLLNKSIPFKPQIAIMMHNINDLNILLYEKTYWNNNPMRSLIVEQQPFNLQLMISSLFPRIYNVLSKVKHQIIQRDEFQHRRGKEITIDTEFILNEFSKSLELFINTARINNVRPILMTQPNRFLEKPDKEILEAWTMEHDFGIGYKQYRKMYSLMHEEIRRVGIHNNVLVIDLERSIPKSNEYMYDVVHLNNKGSKMVANKIAQHLTSYIGY